jgi:hypothetical protein
MLCGTPETPLTAREPSEQVDFHQSTVPVLVSMVIHADHTGRVQTGTRFLVRLMPLLPERHRRRQGK